MILFYHILYNSWMNAIEAGEILSLYKSLTLLDRLHIYIRLRRLPFEAIEKHVPKKGKILDFGCGHGFFSLYLSKRSKERDILGVDVDKEKINIASNSAHDGNVSFRYAQDTMRYLEEKLCYNSIVIINVLYLLKRESQERILEKASRALAAGGKLLIIEPDASLKLRTFYEIMRESIMLKLLRKTQGTNLTFNRKEWWINNLKKYFGKIEYESLIGKKHHIMYICTK